MPATNVRSRLRSWMLPSRIQTSSQKSWSCTPSDWCRSPARTVACGYNRPSQGRGSGSSLSGQLSAYGPIGKGLGIEELKFRLRHALPHPPQGLIGARLRWPNRLTRSPPVPSPLGEGEKQTLAQRCKDSAAHPAPGSELWPGRSLAYAYQLYKPVCDAQHWLTAVLTSVTMPPMTPLGVGAFEPSMVS
jgi:hypothetical protein